MGWTYIPGISRRDLIADRTKGWQRTHESGVEVQSQCLAHCYRGGSFSGVLWSVWERTFENHDGGDKYRTQRWIQCDVMQYDRKDEGWGYKDLEEDMGPYHFSCPLGYLRIVPIEPFGGNAEWRAGVAEYHERKLEKRRAKVLT